MPSPIPQAGVVFAVLSVLLLVADVEYSMVNNFQPQGRYLFLGLVPFALLLLTGLYVSMSTSYRKAFALVIPIVWLGVLNIGSLMLVSSVHI